MKSIVDCLLANWPDYRPYRPDLRYANLRYANLRYANLRYADLRYAKLQGADLRYAKLQGADLRNANLRNANLRNANLQGADLRYADLQEANLQGADLSQTKGIPTAREFLDLFEHDEQGVVVYRAWGGSFSCPAHWEPTPNAVLTETPNPSRTSECGSGVNFSTLEWVRRNYPEDTIWRCRIEWRDLADVVVPFNSDKARCARLTLLEELTLSASESQAKQGQKD